ncbi:DedA family protein [Terracoccus sp. 273MFTsu3.1]|uniref:DedA family protein n=1 Tax=Terracoccus sp. 273MFTsu3.1 TaxID=1172188 RepID=UPI0003601799|nr:DedA family protein [Terracoccus sp. 273MFTsu3.1]
MHPAAIGWLDPTTLLTQFGGAFLWISIAFVFIECGLLFPFLPGDSLLFATGLFIANGHLHLPLAVVLPALFLAAIAGNAAGYEIGRAAGPAVYRRDHRFLKREHLDRSHAFFERHGSKALVLGRFVPIVRTFITVAAGASRMSRRHFLTWSAVGAAIWVTALTLLGYYIGRAFPGLQNRIDLLVVGLVVLSLVPVAIEWLRHRRDRNPQSDPPQANTNPTAAQSDAGTRLARHADYAGQPDQTGAPQ